MFLRMWSLGILLFFMGSFTGVSLAYEAADISMFQQANQDYRGGDFENAISAYDKLTEKYPEAAVFYYNLGNSYFRDGVLGGAILAYERALLREPRDRDTRQNLKYVKGLLEYRIEDKRNWYLRAGEAVLKRFTEEEFGLLALLTNFLFMLGVLLTLLFRPGSSWGWWRKSTMTLLIVFSLLFGAKNVETHVMSDAIVMANEAEVRYGPSDSDQVAFRLGEGLKVYVVDRRTDWSRIVLDNGESGWVKNRQIAEVNQ